MALVEDEETIRETVSLALRREGYRTELYDDGADAWQAMSELLPDLAILDIGLPRMDGLELCRRLRGRSERLPIIFVTSREEEFDRVLGLEIGADDYLCKPFSMRELVARVKVLLRRASLSVERSAHEDVLQAGDLVLDPLRFATTWKAMPVSLTVTEFMILQALASRAGIVKTRDQLIDAAYPERVSVTDRTIDSHVKRIRRKLQAVDPAFDQLEAVYGAGYRFVQQLRMKLLRRPHLFGRHRPSRIGLRLLAFNLLVVFVPVAGILYLDVYEAELLESQERGMVQQARLMAAGLAGNETLSADSVSGMLTALGEQADARIRVFNPEGQVVGDSARYTSRQPVQTADAYSAIAKPRRRLLYRVGAGLVHLRNRIRRQHLERAQSWRYARAPSEPTPAIPPEVRAALAGRYGAATRATPGQRSLTLSSAVPVQHGGRVTGAVVVSQSTFRILQALYEVRLRLFEIVLLSMASAAVLTWLASSTIVNPIVRLRSMAAALASRGSDLSGVFGRIDRKDEIGDLARSLEELAGRLDAHIKLLESFAADVSHEFRNPLAAIRTAAETVASADSPEDRERFRGDAAAGRRSARTPCRRRAGAGASRHRGLIRAAHGRRDLRRAEERRRGTAARSRSPRRI